MNEALHYLTIRQLGSLIRATRISSVDVIDACLARIHALNRRLNAFITVLAEEARDAAKVADDEIRAGGWRGPLHGVPVGIKDFYDTAHIRTTAASEMFKDRVPAADAVSVAKLKQAGAIVVGKTNMHQLGMGTTGLDSWFGPVRNPWNEAYIPGGSSSGSAAAIAAGLCYATLDTDAIGSCRLPAACCGVVGFKGTYGLVSSKGILEGEQADEAVLWLSHPGLTTRNLEDTAIVVKAVAEPNGTWPGDVRGDPSGTKPLRIGIADNFKADPTVKAAFAAALDVIGTLGHQLIAAHAPFEMPRFGDVRSIERDRQTIANRAFAAVDVLVLPTTTTSTPAVSAARANPQALSPENTMFANYFGLPAVSVPCGVDEHGLPLGLQIVGKPWDEATVLQLALHYEQRYGRGPTHPIP